MDGSQSHRRVVRPAWQTTDRQAPPGPALRSLRARRSAGLVSAVRQLDASIDQASREAIADHIRAEYERDIGDIPVGFVSACQLGPPYVDHILDLGGRIIEHYAPADPMPEPFAQARMLARSPAYAYVEVYLSGMVVPVQADGTAVL